jgi:hypothetical protein
MTTKPPAAKPAPKRDAPAESTEVTESPAPADAPAELAEAVPPAYASKDDTKIPVLAEDDVVTLTGRRFRVRGLSRYECNKLPDPDAADYDTKMIFAGLLQPEGMTEADIEAWRRAAPNMELIEVMSKITDLSGMGRDAGKAAYKSFRGESDA